MIIDIHTHTFPDKIAASTIELLSGKSHTKAFTDATAASLCASMREAGIGLSVILPVATAPRQVQHINDRAAAANESTAETGLLSFAAMHPDLEAPEAELERIASLGFKGIKLHPVYQGVDIDDPRFVRILRRCRDLGLVVIIHAGHDIGFPGIDHCLPEMIYRAYDKTGPFPFVLAHMGGWKVWAEVKRVLAGTGVYLDTAFSTGRMTPLEDGYYSEDALNMLDEEQFADMVHAFGADHVLFGTDSPWSEQKASVSWMRQVTLLSEEEKEMIFAGNAKQLLGID